MALLTTLLLNLFSSFFLQAPEPNLKITFVGIENPRGNLMIRVRNENQESVQLKVLPVKSKKESTAFTLPAGRYAVDVYHDENGNKELDKNLVGMPTEKYGFSNNPSATFGPPDFEQQLVKLDQDRTIEIKLK